MKKRLFVLVLALFVGIFLVACDEKKPPVVEDPELTQFHIFFNDNVTIDFGSEFNVLSGVTAVGNDYKEYTDKVTYTSTATISATHMLDTTVSGTIKITYRVAVGTVVGTKERTITVRDEAYVEPEPEWKGYGLTVENGENNVTITYENTPEQWWNNNAQLEIKDFDGTKNSIKFTFTGVATQTYLFKIEGGGVNKETPIVADGTLQTITLDLTLMTEAQRDGLNLIVVFVQTVGASGTVVVNDWTYGDTLVVEEPEWTGYNFTVVQNETQATFTYPATPTNWWENNAQLPIIGFDGTKNSVKFTFTGVDTHEYLFKIEGGGVNKEQAIVADGTEQTITLDLSLMTEAQRNSLNLIIIFVKTKDAAGSVVVKTWEYGPFIQPTEPQWQTAGAVTVAKEGTTVTITYTNTPTEWWNNHAKLQVVDFDQTKTKILFTFTGVSGQEYKFKVEGPGVAKEEAVTATGESQVFTFDISTLSEAQRDAINLLVVFNTVVGASGTIVITNIQFAN